MTVRSTEGSGSLTYVGFMRLPVIVIAAAGLLSGDDRCLPCHSRQVKSYVATGMGRSITQPSPEGASDNQILHRKSGTRLSISFRGGNLVHSIDRNGERSSYEVSWAIG